MATKGDNSGVDATVRATTDTLAEAFLKNLRLLYKVKKKQKTLTNYNPIIIK